MVKESRDKRSFFLLEDNRWSVKFDQRYYPIILPGPPYEGRPAVVTRKELEEIDFYEPNDNRGDRAKFITRSAYEVLVFFVPRSKKTGEKLHANGKWYLVDIDEQIPLSKIF